ncbi:hypothetical protein AZE42_11939 [Rhizopogon vesiculosus]|uniref:Uncharacterized protein n=1 Tax=Rhizopogon vesiculosus TaxID=180088 RepID=A0A1J8QDH1_9AGAM|nr:hypothetical protein AZE42_11939 [Rhizopogon vesiculosus]
MLRLFCVALSLFLSLQLAIAEPVSTNTFPRHAKASSLVKQSLISALLVRRGKFNARASESHALTIQACVPRMAITVATMYIPVQTVTLVSDMVVVPASRRHVVEPHAAPLVVIAVTKVAVAVTPVTSAAMTLREAVCCPSGSSCIANSDYCTYGTGGGSGGGDSGGGTTTTTSLTSIVQPGTTTSLTSIVQPGTTSPVSITFNGPTTLASSNSNSSTHSSGTSTVSSVTSTTSGLGIPSTTGAAAPGIVLTPGRQLAALVAVVGVPILHNFAYVL